MTQTTQALEALLGEKSVPFLGGSNPMTPLEFAIWFTDRGTTAVSMNEAAAELAALRAENERLKGALEQIARLTKRPALRDIARAALSQEQG